MNRNILIAGAAALTTALLALPASRSIATDAPNHHHRGPISRESVTEIHAVREVRKGREIFRRETFGDEDFWGGLLGLHKGIAGKANGGVGPGVGPADALAVGLKVDVTALPKSVRRALRKGDLDLEDPAVTLELLGVLLVVALLGALHFARSEE